MTTFETIFWWYGVILFTAGVVLFYGTLAYAVITHMIDLLKKK
jgi:hypothetical protein